MKALTVKNPYATMIWGGLKTVEVRTWETKYRGDFLLTSSAGRVRDCICGHALAVIRLADVVPFEEKHLFPAKLIMDEEALEVKSFVQSRMPLKPCFAWILEDVRLIKPFPIKGKLNLWNADVEDKLEFMSSGFTEKQENAWVNKYCKPLIYAPTRRTS